MRAPLLALALFAACGDASAPLAWPPLPDDAGTVFVILRRDDTFLVYAYRRASLGLEVVEVNEPVEVTVIAYRAAFAIEPGLQALGGEGSGPLPAIEAGLAFRRSGASWESVDAMPPEIAALRLPGFADRACPRGVDHHVEIVAWDQKYFAALDDTHVLTGGYPSHVLIDLGSAPPQLRPLAHLDGLDVTAAIVARDGTAWLFGKQRRVWRTRLEEGATVESVTQDGGLPEDTYVRRAIPLGDAALPAIVLDEGGRLSRFDGAAWLELADEDDAREFYRDVLVASPSELWTVADTREELLRYRDGVPSRSRPSEGPGGFRVIGRHPSMGTFLAGNRFEILRDRGDGAGFVPLAGGAALEGLRTVDQLAVAPEGVYLAGFKLMAVYSDDAGLCPLVADGHDAFGAALRVGEWWIAGGVQQGPSGLQNAIGFVRIELP